MCPCSQAATPRLAYLSARSIGGRLLDRRRPSAMHGGAAVSGHAGSNRVRSDRHIGAMTPHYDAALVVISVVIAILASYVALDLTGRVSGARGPAQRVWWLGGALAMGVGIWSMHFVGMLAFHLPVPITYDVPLVALSVLVAIAASAVALAVASRPTLPHVVLVTASLFMGAAISGMHYIGMAAMRLPAVIVWDPRLVITSILIAITASLAALLLAFYFQQSPVRVFRWSKLWAATVMGMAIVGMHYTAMAAASFRQTTGRPTDERFVLHTPGLAVAVTLSTIVILAGALVSAAVEERARLLAREQRARRQAEAANRLKDEFLATLSHELRTPLNVIGGRAQMLGMAADDPARVRQMAEAISRNSEVLRHLVEDLLDVSRMTLGGVQLRWQPLDLAVLVDAAAAALQPTAAAKGIRLTVAAAHGLPSVRGDQTRLQQVVWNLLMNAVKFTPSGGEIRVDLGRWHDEVVLTVEDTGQGIDPAFLPHVFDMFRQAEPMSSRVHGGLGLGLSIVRRLVELHGGRVSAASDGRGHGSTFTVYLPYGPSPTMRVGNQPSPHSSGANGAMAASTAGGSSV
jgi:diguanylate cyclase